MEERLQKVLARAGVASRREAEKLIVEGRVAVNGRTVRELGAKVDASLDEVRVDTIALPREATSGGEARVYLLLNKPKGVLCTVKDTHGRPTVVDLVPPRPGKRLYPVGRLDEDSEGLVLLTDDGDLTDRLTHPRFGVPKTYDVRLRGHLKLEDAQEFEKGVWLSEGRTGASRVRIRRAGREVSHLHITLTEGRNREIRRAFAKLGFHVLSIKRIQIGPVVARGLPVGAFRPLEKAELEELQAAAAGAGDNRPLRGRRLRDVKKGLRDAGRRRRPGKPDPAQFASTTPAVRDRDGTYGRTRGGRSNRGGARRGPAKSPRPESGKGPRKSPRTSGRSDSPPGGPRRDDRGGRR